MTESIHPEILTLRREALRDAVREHGPEHFDMAYWASEPGFEGCSLEAALDVDIERCGTTCCLAGHGVRVMGTYVRSPQEVCDYFGLDSLAFHRADWQHVELSDGTSLWDLRLHHRGLCFLHAQGWDNIVEPQLAEWQTVLDYLDDLCKHDG